MHCTIGFATRKGYLRAVLSVTIIAIFCAIPVMSTGQTVKAPMSPAAGEAKVLLFNLSPARTFSVVKNSVLFATINSSQQGTVVYADVAAPGDEYQVVESGANPQPPSSPTGVAASGDDSGCATVQWDPNPELDVDFYRVYRGTAPSSYGDSLDVTGSTGALFCGLADGNYYFVVRAHNTAGMLSALSQEANASVSNGNTQPPPAPLLVDASEGENSSIDLSWIPSGSPDVVGYVVEYGSESVAGGAASYEYSVDAGNGSSYSIEGLQDGTWYVAVRSKNFAGMLSAYSAEGSVTLVPTAVFITAFSARDVATGVELVWEIWTDEELRGFHVYRALDGDPAETLLNGGRLIDPAQTSWVDADVEPATTYWYKFGVVGEDGVEHRSQAERVTTRAWSMSLEQNVPNPFNPATSISFIVPEPSRTELVVYDVTGAMVRRLVGGVSPAGRHSVNWDGTNNVGEQVSSGTYFYRLTVGKRSTTRKMLLLK